MGVYFFLSTTISPSLLLIFVNRCGDFSPSAVVDFPGDARAQCTLRFFKHTVTGQKVVINHNV